MKKINPCSSGCQAVSSVIKTDAMDFQSFLEMDLVREKRSVEVNSGVSLTLKNLCGRMQFLWPSLEAEKHKINFFN